MKTINTILCLGGFILMQNAAVAQVPNYIDSYVGNGSITINQIAGVPNQIYDPMDLDFHPNFANMELWVINRATENTGGNTVIISDAGEPTQTSVYKKDGNAWHFMSLPTGIAFSENGNWASSTGVFDANHNGGAAFTGPTLWSSDLAIYAQPSGGNGSHLDMVHVSPYCQGIASEKDNVFWVFDGYSNDIVRYDFANDHGAGGDYHADAIVRRYSDDAVAKDPNDIIVSHLELDANEQWLYVVDHGNQRVIRIDITTGSDMGGAPNYPSPEALAEYSEYTGYTQETVVSGLSKPAGIDLVGNRMIVSEHESGEIIIYDISTMPAIELDRISTGYSSVQGITIGPKGYIWFVDEDSRGVYRAEVANLGVNDLTITANFDVFPNPSSGDIKIYAKNSIDAIVEVRDLQGKLVSAEAISGQTLTMNLNVRPGMYFVTLIVDEYNSMTQRLVIK
ncbi:MAG: hypothetical protein ACI837_003569 [Crocinitomicaceae bacterium]|jgi:hypothetical protein